MPPALTRPITRGQKIRAGVVDFIRPAPRIGRMLRVASNSPDARTELLGARRSFLQRSDPQYQSQHAPDPTVRTRASKHLAMLRVSLRQHLSCAFQRDVDVRLGQSK